MLKNIKDTLVVVAMSGGVDSSVVAGLLIERGYKVIGITLQLHDQFNSKSSSRCTRQDIYDAQIAAEKLGISHYVFNYEEKFKTSIIEDFVDSYVKGETPIPCIRCNYKIKFQALLKIAKKLNAKYLATGHYVSKLVNNNIIELHKGQDSKKDQSYFLFKITKNQLQNLIFPLGCMTKEETRNHAKRFRLHNADKKESQGLCFANNNSYFEIIKKLRPESFKKGKIMHIDGYELGVHDGIVHFTKGQRKSMNIAYPTPLYVVRIDEKKNILYVGPKYAIQTKEFTIKEINWLGEGKIPEQGLELIVKLSSAHHGTLAKLYNIERDTIKVTLTNADSDISPGQACVFYQDTQMLGGGWIQK